MSIARSSKAGAVEVQRGMREIQKRIWKFNETVSDESKKATLHAKDGIHLNELGHLAMAFSILKGLGAPSEVSAATLAVHPNRSRRRQMLGSPAARGQRRPKS
jgi:hypothetical protein